MINRKEKADIVTQYRKHETDTGSSEVQIAVITERINNLNSHFKSFPKDSASRTGLMKLVGQRRKLLDYLKRSDEKRYEALISSLGLRK